MTAWSENVSRLVWVILGLAVLLAPPIAAQDQRQPDDESVARGRFIYRVYCLNCHGEAGRGNGVSAPLLKIEPTDLTRLARGNGGEFPTERVYRIIDGREEVRGHSSRGMPIWGLSLQELASDVNQEDEVREKILDVIDYLQSLQGASKD